MTHPVEASLELAAERAGDITAEVYERLFAAHPEMRGLFVRDTDGAVRGQMLSQAIEALLDFTGAHHFAANLIRSEIVNHENLGVPNAVFPIFFTVVRDTVRDACGPVWTPEMATTWEALLTDIEALSPAA